MLGMLCISMSPPLLLLSLLVWPFSLFSLVLPSAETDVEPSVADTGFGLGGALQREISQTTPVKVFSLNPPLAHLRHGFPERSSARRPALMAPWFALGPSLWDGPAGPDLPGSTAPSSLGQS